MKHTEIKNVVDACKVLGLDAFNIFPNFNEFPESDRSAMIAHAQLIIITRALNLVANDGKEWKPDWNDYDQYKYYPWFEMGGSSGFLFLGFDYWDSRSGVGSRLCFKSSELAMYAGEQFTDLYRIYFVM